VLDAPRWRFDARADRRRNGAHERPGVAHRDTRDRTDTEPVTHADGIAHTDCDGNAHTDCDGNAHTDPHSDAHSDAAGERRVRRHR
jgi:hypothetical protein